MFNSNLAVETDTYNATDLFPDLFSGGIVRFTKQGKTVVITFWNMILKASLANDTSKTYVYNTVVPEKYRQSYSELVFYLIRGTDTHLTVLLQKGNNAFVIRNISGQNRVAGENYNGEVVYIQY